LTPRYSRAGPDVLAPHVYMFNVPCSHVCEHVA
jgi:hypothetical protein